jgi:hypothetical protein
MARLSKVNVNALIKFLLTKKDDKIKSEESVIKALIETWVMRRVPISVKEVFYNDKRYLKTTTGVQVSGQGFSYEHFNTHNECPKSENGSYIQLILDKGEGDELSKLKSNLDKLKKERDSLKNDLEVLIYSLGTAKKVIENIPDAEEFLRVLLGASTTPAVISSDVNSILNRLK